MKSALGCVTAVPFGSRTPPGLTDRVLASHPESEMGIFTGLIIEIGRVRRVNRRADGAFLIIEARKVLEGTRIGDSISINGVDLTVIEMGSDYFAADASLETLNRSTLGELRVGSRVNLERALAVGERLGGHMVQGHVDGAGELSSVIPEGNAYRMRFGFPRELGRYIAMKGSITVDGISLTVAGLGDDWFEVAIIPHTWRETSLSDLRAGDRVNLEVDVLAKYVERLMQREPEPAANKLTMEYLIERGY
ncbi:MAG TPA: riboflavin synthase [Blastocatellia bacterium]|nr:riboflavin synthase [Blastocatellia bacterium]